MIKIQNIFCRVFLWGSLLTGGCVSTVDEPADEATPISFSTMTTRSAVGADKNGMEDFLVWGGFDNQNNLFDAEKVSPGGTYQGTRYWVPEKTHRFYALHPAGLEGAKSSYTPEGDGTITVTGFDTSLKKGKEAVDLMTAGTSGILYTAGQTPNPVSLSFRHELSRVRFTIHTDAPVTISDVKLWGIGYQGDLFTRFTGTDATSSWRNIVGTATTETDTPFSQPESFPLSAGGSRHLLAGAYDAMDDNYGDLLLIPQSLSEMMIFQMTWVYENGSQRTVKVPLPQAGPSAWERGKSYHYQATIPTPTTDMTFTVTIKGWNDRRIDADL